MLLQPAVANHFGVFRDFRPDVVAEALRRAAQLIGAKTGQPLPHVGELQRLVDVGIEPFEQLKVPLLPKMFCPTAFNMISK